MKAARATVAAISQGLVRGFHMACTIAAGTGGAAASTDAVPPPAAAPAGTGDRKSANQGLLEDAWISHNKKINSMPREFGIYESAEALSLTW
jgi:hypothetical protein